MGSFIWHHPIYSFPIHVGPYASAAVKIHSATGKLNERLLEFCVGPIGSYLALINGSLLKASSAALAD